MYRLIFSLLVALVCAGGYVAFGRDSQTSQASSDVIQSQSATSTTSSTPSTSPSSDDSNNEFKNLKVN